jgi:hypothetical protein
MHHEAVFARMALPEPQASRLLLGMPPGRLRSHNAKTARTDRKTVLFSPCVSVGLVILTKEGLVSREGMRCARRAMRTLKPGS